MYNYKGVTNREFLSIGTTPYAEECAQVGAENYLERTLIEFEVFKKQLIRQFGVPPLGADIKLKSFSHDFGTYHELVIWHDEPIEIDEVEEGEEPESYK